MFFQSFVSLFILLCTSFPNMMTLELKNIAPWNNLPMKLTARVFSYSMRLLEPPRRTLQPT